MSITNGYTTLAAVKSRLGIGNTYTATTIAFVASTDKITDTALGLEMFPTGNRITVSGSTSNNGTYTIGTGGVAAEIAVTGSLTDESAGDTVTITDVTDVADDTTLEAIVTACSRAIDDYCGRRFYRNSEDETRYYQAEHADTLFPDDDIGSVTTLYTDSDGDRTYEDTWTSNDFDLLPANAALDGKPYTWVAVTPDGDYTFPPGVAKGVKVVGKFGYSSTTPSQVAEACAILSQRVFKKKDAIFGVLGAGTLGAVRVVQQMIEDDFELAIMLAPFRRVV